MKKFCLLFIDNKMGSEDNEDYNFIEYIFFYLVLIYIFKNNYYKHQYISIIILVILGIFKYLVKLKFDSSNHFNTYILLLNIVNSLLTCIIYGYIKGLMEYKYFSIYKCTYIFGIIDIPIIIALYFISSFFPNKDYNGFFTIKYENKYYFDHFFSLISDFKPIDYISSFLYIIGSGLLQVLTNKIINDFTIFHIAIPFEIHEFIYNMIETSDQKFVFCIVIICTFIEFFFFFIFLEIFELNFCDLNYNTKKNITIRGITETIIDNQNVEENDDTSNSINDEEINKTKKQELSQKEIYEN